MRSRPRPRRASRPSRSLAVLAIALAVGLAAGCALLIPGTLTDVRCTTEGAVGPPACPTGTFCHEGVCRAGPPPVGEPCSMDDVCAPGDHCVDLGTWGLTGDEICSRPCCSSADCGAGTDLVCAPLGPGKLCVPADALARGDVGGRSAGEPCERGSDCRSGECSPTHRACVDTCCSDAECAPFGGACRAGPAGWSCEPAAAPKTTYPLACKVDEECTSGLCLAWDDGVQRCSAPCCSSVECGQTKVVDGLRNILCLPVRHGTTMVLACAASAPDGAERPIGEPCAHDAECRGGRCIDAPPSPGGPSSKVCADVCCTDASCGAPHLFTCAPAAGWEEEGAPEPPAGSAQGFDLQCTRR